MSTIDLSDLQAAVWQTAEDQGHHVNLTPLDLRLQTLIRLALSHSEVSEAWDVVWGMPYLADDCCVQIVEELADTAIRLLEMAWCCHQSLTVTPPVLGRTTQVHLLRHLGLLHSLIDRITQSVKRHGVTPDMAALTQNALGCCWDLAGGLGADLREAIIQKDATNKTRAYQYGTPGGAV